MLKTGLNYFSAENIAEILKAAISEWRINTLSGFPPVSMDNAANVVKAAKLCKTILHIPCLVHTAVQKALKVQRIHNLLARIRKVVGFFHRSPHANDMLLNKAAYLDYHVMTSSWIS